MPVAETVERVGLKPTTEPADAGAVIEPSVSVPMEAGVRLAVTETELPLLEPDAEIFKGPKGLMVCPFTLLYPAGAILDMYPASSERLFFPKIIAPQFFKLAARSASLAGIKSASAAAPALVGIPAVLMLSFNRTGIPNISEGFSVRLLR